MEKTPNDKWPTWRKCPCQPLMTHLLTVDLGPHTLGQACDPEAQVTGKWQKRKCIPKSRTVNKGRTAWAPSSDISLVVGVHPHPWGSPSEASSQGVGESECPGCQVAPAAWTWCLQVEFSDSSCVNTSVLVPPSFRTLPFLKRTDKSTGVTHWSYGKERKANWNHTQDDLSLVNKLELPPPKFNWYCVFF